MIMKIAYPVTVGSAFGPSSQDWIYEASNPTDFFAMNISGAQRLPNGSTIICDGPAGYIFEVASDGATLWTYTNPYGGPVFKVRKYAPDYPGLDDL